VFSGKITFPRGSVVTDHPKEKEKRPSRRGRGKRDCTVNRFYFYRKKKEMGDFGWGKKEKKGLFFGGKERNGGH